MVHADEIAKLCYERFRQLPRRGKPEPGREWTLLAAVVQLTRRAPSDSGLMFYFFIELIFVHHISYDSVASFIIIIIIIRIIIIYVLFIILFMGLRTGANEQNSVNVPEGPRDPSAFCKYIYLYIYIYIFLNIYINKLMTCEG